MSDVDEQQINATLSELSRLLMNEGALMRFSPASGSTEPLQKALIKVFDIYFATKAEDTKQKILDSKEAEQFQKNVMVHHLDEIKKFLSKEKSKEKMSNEKSWSNLSSYLDDLKEGDNVKKKAFAQTLGIVMGAYKVSKEIYGVVKDIGSAVYGLAKDRVELLASLKESGVSLREGFDQSFHELAAETGKSREQFAEFLKKNSKFTAQLNASGIDGARTISVAANQLRTSVGLTRKEIDGTIEYFGDIMHNVWNDTKLNNMDFNSEIISTAKMLKQLAIATGQSTDQIIAHAKEQAKTWQMERIRTNPRFAAQYAAMKAHGADDDFIEGILLGKTNKAVLQAAQAPGGARAVAGFMRWARQTRGMKQEDVARSFIDLINGPELAGFRNQEAWLDNNIDKVKFIGQKGEHIFTSAGLIGRNQVKLDKNGAIVAMDTNNPETKAIMAYSEFNKSLNDLKTTLSDAIAPGLEKSASFLNMLKGPLSTISEFFKNHPMFTASAYWLWEIGSGIGKAFLNVVTPVMMLNYLSNGKLLGNTMSTAIEKGASFLFSKSMWIGVAKLFGAAAGVLIGGYIVNQSGSWGADIAEAFGQGKKTAAAAGGTIGAGGGALAGAAIGSIIPGVGTAIGAGIGAIIGGLGGGIYGGVTGYKEMERRENQNDPAKVNSVSAGKEYLSPTDNLQAVTVQSAHHTISVAGMEMLNRSLKSIDENTKMMYSELRHHPKVGTNMATA